MAMESWLDTTGTFPKSPPPLIDDSVQYELSQIPKRAIIGGSGGGALYPMVATFPRTPCASSELKLRLMICNKQELDFQMEQA